MPLTPTQIKSKMNALSVKIADLTVEGQSLYQKLVQLESALNAIPTSEADLITDIGALTGGTDFNDLAKDELTEFTAEFTALKAKVTAAIAALV